VLLVRFGGEEGFGKPASFDSGDDVSIVEEVVDVYLKNGALVNTIMDLTASPEAPVSLQNWKPSMGRRAPAGANASQISWMMQSSSSFGRDVEEAVEDWWGMGGVTQDTVGAGGHVINSGSFAE